MQVLEGLQRNAARCPLRRLGEHQLAQLGEQRGRKAQQAVRQQQPGRNDQHGLRVARLEAHRVDQRLQQNRHADVGQLRPDHECQRGQGAPLVLPQIRAEPFQGGPVGVRARLRRGRAGWKRNGRGTVTGVTAHSGTIAGWCYWREIVPMSAKSSDPKGLAAARGPALPVDKELVMKVIPMPADSNANGDIFGGWVMAQVDLAGAVLPARLAQGRMATVAVKEFIFKQPVRVGDILSFFSEVTRVGRTSVTVQVEVYAERFRTQGQYLKVTEASLTYVAIDDEGRPTPLPVI